MAKNIALLIQSDGTLSIGDVTYQNQQFLLLASPGELKENPISGVGARNFIESDDADGLARKIRTEFTLDGMIVNQINVDLPDLYIDANY